MLAVIVVILCGSCVATVFSSYGDQTYSFNKCKAYCNYKYCRDQDYLRASRHPNQMLQYKGNSFLHRLQYAVLWRCPHECNYVCMWKTVEAFNTDELYVPQFFGKWPMIRILGIQDIASSVASFMNLVVAIFMFRKFWMIVPYDSPGYGLWWTQFLCSIFAWSSATIFHVTDTDLTEKLDYFSAFLLGLCVLYLTIVRTILTERFFLKVFFGIIIVIFYIVHVSYLIFVRFDYAYNMTVFIIIGVVTVLLWSMWSLKHWHLRHCKYIILWAVWLAVFSILEIRDFAPIFWIFDSHSVWHMATVFITVPLYKFAQMDCLYLREIQRRRLD